MQLSLHVRKEERNNMKDIKDKIESLNEYKDKLSLFKDDIKPVKGEKTMSGWVIALIVIAAVIVGLFILTFLVYMFNLDMKLMAAMEPIFLKHYDKVKRDEHL